MPDADPIETAWRIHSAQVDWTGKVDSKASFALAIQSAVLAAVINLSTGHGALSTMADGWPTTLYWFGVAAIATALLSVSFVVRPRLRTRSLEAERAENFIYFGHLRSWEAKDLADSLRTEDVLPVLARQIVAMSKVSWRKHRYLQFSMTGAVLGTGCLALAAWINR